MSEPIPRASTSTSTRLDSQAGPVRNKPIKACDQCNYRKIKCKAIGESGKCVACRQSEIDCTRFKVAKKRKPNLQKLYENVPATADNNFRAPPAHRPSQPPNHGMTSDWTQPQPPIPHRDAYPHNAESSTTGKRNTDTQSSRYPTRYPVDPQLVSPVTSTSLSDPSPNTIPAGIPKLPLGDGETSLSQMDFGATSWLDDSALFMDPNFLSSLVGVECFTANPLGETSSQPSSRSATNSTERKECNATALTFPYLEDSLNTSIDNNLSREALPSDPYIGPLLERYFSTVHRVVPFICQREIEEAFANRLHESSFKFRLILLSILGIAEMQGPRVHDPTMTEGKSSREERSAVQLLCRFNGMPEDLRTLSFEHVVANYAAFIAFRIRGDEDKSWFYLQQAISFVQILGMDRMSTYKLSEDVRSGTLRLKIYYSVWLLERCFQLKGLVAGRRAAILRLSDTVWQDTRIIREQIHPDWLEGFPLEQVQLYEVITARTIPCWLDVCSSEDRPCSGRWTPREAADILNDLTNQFEMAVDGRWQANDRSKLMRNTRMALHVAWLRDGFWRTWRRHGLIGLEGDSSLTLQALAVYTESTAQYCQTFTSHHLDPTADWAGKVYDIAMTAVHTVKTIQSTMAHDGHVDASFNATRQVLLAAVYKLASTLTLYAGPSSTEAPQIIKALASIA